MTAAALELPLAWEAEERRAPGRQPGGGGAPNCPGGAGAPSRERGAGSASTDPGGEPTLDSLLSGVWEGLAAHRSVPCPLCGGEIVPDYGAHALPVGGRCRTCDTRLS